MSFGSFREPGQSGTPAPMAEINTTPLVDVMLVLLVIFIVTAPLLTHGIRVDLPKAATAAAPEPVAIVTLSIDANGQVWWDDKPVDDAALQAAMTAAAAREPQPELHLRADLNTRYQRVAELMAMARNAGLGQLGFVTDPNLPAPGR